jgi:hypothetical protein
LLIEEARTNLATYSEAIVSGTGWFIGNVTVANSGTGPSGVTAQEITETTSVGVHSIGNLGGSGGIAATPVVSGTTYTGSIFIKKSTVDWVQLTLGSVGFGSVQYANFNIANGTVGNFAGLASGTLPRIEEFSDGWYRCSMSATATSTVNTLNVGVVFTNNIDSLSRVPAYLGSTANKFLASLAQLEAGSFPTSYIPTVASSVVRSADLCSITGAAFTGFYNQSEGTVLADVSGLMNTTFLGNRPFVAISDGTYNNFFSILKASGIAAIRGEGITGGGGNQFTLSNLYDPSTQYKVALGVKTNDTNMAANGSLKTTDTSVTLPSTMNRLDLRDPTGAAGGHPSGHIAAIRYFKKRLSNQKLQSLTA